MRLHEALQERGELKKRLETETNEQIRFDIERRIGDLNEMYINVNESREEEK